MDLGFVLIQEICPWDYYPNHIFRDRYINKVTFLLKVDLHMGP